MAVYKSKYTGPQVDALLDKINTLSNPLVIKGRVDTEQDLQNISNPQPGWVYLVGLSTDTYFKEFYYTDSNTWEYIGTTQITVDQTIVEDSENPVAGGAVYTALGNKVDKETDKGLSTNDFTTAEKTKLDSLAEIKTIGTGLDLDSNGELTATGGGSGGTTNYNDLSNKPQINGNTLSGNKTSAQLGLASASDIPTVPITAIQKNGTGITPVSGTVNITVPTQASDINAATATQGDKADTAIQGIKVNSSTVNPDANKVVNITIPTTAADVSALPDTTKYAVALSLTINSSTFVMTGQLKDQNGDNLGTAQTIDLPLESVVVGGSYNSQTKKVVLTLQNGNTIEFSVADLVSGLQTELSASNKLNPAYINYDSTHRAVSDTEKSTWNGKQDALTTAQLAAVNSGIDSAKVEQIETNKNNILNSIKVYPDIIGLGVNCNANSVDDNTLYRLQTNSVTNFPTDYPATGALHYIVTIKNTSTNGVQRSQYIFSNEMKTKWCRLQFNNNWNAWSNISSSGGTIECGSGKQYTRLRDAVAAGVLNGGTVIVYAGSYNLATEFATEIAAETGTAGIALGNGVHVKFMAGAYVTAEFDGSSEWVYESFQPFYSTGSFTLENAHIVAQNCRYCVHDEMGNSTTPYSSKYINCHMEYTNTRQNVKYIQCIGGGLGLHGNILIDGGFYKSSTTYGAKSYGSYGTPQNCQQPISYHNSYQENADSKVVIRNVYLADRGYFRFGNYGSSTILSNVEISGCSVGLPTMNMFETVDSTNVNISYVLFNNVVRNTAVPFDFSRIIGLYENGVYNENAIIPSDYQQLAYLRSTGTQYIDTGIKPTGNDRITMTAQFTSINTTGGDTAFGTRDSANTNAFIFGAVGFNGGYFEIAYGNNPFLPTGTFNSDTNMHNFTLDKGKGYVDNALCNDYTPQTFDCSYNAYVFARNQEGAMQEATGSNIKVYGYRHYKNGVLSAHLVPCKRKSDNVLGMYDLVSNTFLTNAGTGEFSAS